MGSAPTTADEARKPRNRWLVVVAAIVLNLALGALYSWPVFSNFLEKALGEPYRWRHFETQLVFSMATVFLAVGVIAAGQLSERHAPRALLLISALFTGSGYILGGVLPLRPVFVTITIGAMAGFGIGVAYALPISLAAKWFPERKGLVTGLAMAGFGLGAVLWSQLFDLFLDDRLGISLTFAIYGVVFAGMILFAMGFFFNPPAGHREAMLARIASRAERAVAPGIQARMVEIATGSQGGGVFTRRELVRQWQLYALVYTFMAGSAIGLMIIGMSKSYPIERLMAAGYSPETARRITGFAALILFPVFNGSGRIVFGWLSDWLGWKPVIVTSYLVQSAILFCFPWLMGIPVTVFVALVLLAVCYGGNFTIFPIATAQIWGTEHLAANYGLVFLAFGVGALVGPPLSGAAKDAGMINTVFLTAGFLLALGAILVAILKKPVRKRAPPPAA